MSRAVFLLLAAIISSAVGLLPSLEGIHKKFEFQHSFKPPHVANDKGQIHFWDHGGDSLATEEQVRVCPSLHDRSGWVWCKEKFSHANWMFDVSLKIAGRGRVGADGMAFWFTAERGDTGPVFGNVVDWKGMGVVLDSFDNDGKGDGPKIQVFLSNGTLNINHFQDGLGQDSGSCQRDYRNRHHPVKLRVTYMERTLEVWVHDGTSDIVDNYDLCARVEDVHEIPSEGYFGISAATGGLSDDHDVLSFVTHSLSSLKQQQEKIREKEEQVRFDEISQEYEKMTEEFQKKKDDYNKLHPSTEPAPGEEIWQNEMETMENVRLVLHMQKTLLTELRTLSASISSGQGAPGSSKPASTSGGGDQLAAMEGRLNHHLSEMRAKLEQTAPSGQLTASEQLQPLYEMKSKIMDIAAKIDQIHERTQSRPPPVAAVSSCVSPWLFILITLLQSGAILGLIIFNNRQERNAKKFF